MLLDFSCSSKVEPLTKLPGSNGQQESPQQNLLQALIISPVSHYFLRKALHWVGDRMCMMAKERSKYRTVRRYLWLNHGCTAKNTGPPNSNCYQVLEHKHG